MPREQQPVIILRKGQRRISAIISCRIQGAIICILCVEP